jgi:hypothetical protein
MDGHELRAQAGHPHSDQVPVRQDDADERADLLVEGELAVCEEPGSAELEPVESAVPFDSIFWRSRIERAIEESVRFSARPRIGTVRSFEQWYRDGTIRVLHLSERSSGSGTEYGSGLTAESSKDAAGPEESPSGTVVFSEGTFSLTDEAVIHASHAEDEQLLALIESIDRGRSGSDASMPDRDEPSETGSEAARSDLPDADGIREAFGAQYCLAFTATEAGIGSYQYSGDGEVADGTGLFSPGFLGMLNKPDTAYTGDIPPERIAEFSFISYPYRTDESWFLLRSSSIDRKVKILLSFSASDSPRNEIMENMIKVTI